MKSISLFALVIGLAGVPLVASAAGNQGASHPGHGNATAGSGTAATRTENMTEGEVRKVDKDTGKITLRHAELKALDMPAMTMVFQVKDKAMLEQVKTGDKVSFVAEKVDGKFTVTQIEAKQ